MLVITDRLTIGQITLTVRVIVQILSYGGFFLIGRLLLGNAPRTASVNTHDIVNRITSSNSALTLSSMNWVFNSFRFRNGDLVRPSHLLICVILFTLYGPFVTLSDVGLLGFSSCLVPGPSFLDHPSSIATDDQARTAIAAAMLPGTDPATINAYRCDSAVSLINLNATFRNCTAWHNSTYADSAFFTGINMTDSAALTPLQLSRETNTNSYWVGPGPKRIETTMIRNGILVDPHETGFRAIFGVPELAREHKAILKKAMALEVDTGCMELGIYSIVSRHPDSISGFDIFATNGTWRRYSGPDYLHNVLSKTVDDLREQYLPLFHKDTVDQDGSIIGYFVGPTISSQGDSVTSAFLPDLGDSSFVTAEIVTNCTRILYQQAIQTPLVGDYDSSFPACSILGISGERFYANILNRTLSRMVCASTTQVNMVSATVQMDAGGDVTLELMTHLPSDLNYVLADYWNVGDNPGFTPYYVDRYVLQDNPSSPVHHYIVPRSHLPFYRFEGPGTAGTVFNDVGFSMITIFPDTPITDLALNVFEHDDTLPLNASTVTRWAGQVGASYILASVAYNGWTARFSEPILVTPTGGKPAICYKPFYAIGFFPLVTAAVITIAWFMSMFIRKQLTGLTQLEKLYEGMNPFVQVACPKEKEVTLLTWRGPESHLEVVSQSEAVQMAGGETALGYLMSELDSLSQG